MSTPEALCNSLCPEPYKPYPEAPSQQASQGSRLKEGTGGPTLKKKKWVQTFTWEPKIQKFNNCTHNNHFLHKYPNLKIPVEQLFHLELLGYPGRVSGIGFRVPGLWSGGLNDWPALRGVFAYTGVRDLGSWGLCDPWGFGV